MTATARAPRQKATGNPQADRAQAPRSGSKASRATRGTTEAGRDRAAKPEAKPEAANHSLPTTATPKPAKAEQNGKPARAYQRQVNDALIAAAGDLVEQLVPASQRAEVAKLVSNTLHHLATPKTGWPTKALPVPDRSDWR